MFNKTFQQIHTPASVIIKKTCENSFFIRVRSITGLPAEHEATMDEIPMKWILGNEPQLNGRKIEVMQLVGEQNLLFAEVRYKE